MEKGKISIIIPQFKTEWFIRLCLRSVRKYSKGPIQVIVVDNNSGDGSLDYLRALPWIELIENTDAKTGMRAHREALDLGVSMATGEWICLFHSDTIVLKAGWDLHLLEFLKKSGAVGLSSKVSYVNIFDSFFNKFTRRLRDIRTIITHPERVKDAQLRSYCYLIRRDFFEKFDHKFTDEEAGEIGHEFYIKNIMGKHPFIILGRQELQPILWHTNNVTSVLTGQWVGGKHDEKLKSRIASLNNDKINKILNDGSLDE